MNYQLPVNYPVTTISVVNNMIGSFPGKMIWKIDGAILENTNEFEQVNISTI